MSFTVAVEASKDNYVIGATGYKDLNCGGAAGMSVSYRLSGLLYFDLSVIPVDAICLSAILTLTAGDPFGAQTHELWAILSGNANWPEGTKAIAIEAGSSCWNWFAYNTINWAGSVGLGMAGVDYDPVPLGTIAYPEDAQLSQVDAALPAAVVQTWFGAVNSNHGIKITGVDVTSRSWLSRHQGNALYRPKLTVVYEIPEPEPPEPPTPHSARGTIVEISEDGVNWTDVSAQVSGVGPAKAKRKSGEHIDFSGDAPQIVIGKREPMVISVALAYQDDDSSLAQTIERYHRDKTPIYLRWTPYGNYLHMSKWYVTSPASRILAVEYPGFRALAGDPAFVSFRLRCSELLVAERHAT